MASVIMRLAVALAAGFMAEASSSPSFSQAACKDMFATMVKLGGAVPPSDFVAGCTEVCAKVKEMKEYWGSDDKAAYACEQGKSYGCAWAAAPPVTLQRSAAEGQTPCAMRGEADGQAALQSGGRATACERQEAHGRWTPE
eukprot:CAMPEP_0171170152 /NCGR_PEP_ID=MMETSP0790-20130122/8570_1 /TAXON_ID=2925 /ORGANISM="Alexandrium catenella, Strain OF101" /LENGTH=140 /DNA_ID=CAMNT_0011634997 /DNA_START=57 /DNA_END=477 /DNA_ORIENTATION=-